MGLDSAHLLFGPVSALNLGSGKMDSAHRIGLSLNPVNCYIILHYIILLSKNSKKNPFKNL
jgi:hypothetical protein